MMAYVARQVANIANMPRGGPDASCLDRLLQTGRDEYLDRNDADDAAVVQDRLGAGSVVRFALAVIGH